MIVGNPNVQAVAALDASLAAVEERGEGWRESGIPVELRHDDAVMVAKLARDGLQVQQLFALREAVRALLESAGAIPRGRGRPVPVSVRVAQLKAAWRESLDVVEPVAAEIQAGAAIVAALAECGSGNESQGGEA